MCTIFAICLKKSEENREDKHKWKKCVFHTKPRSRWHFIETNDNCTITWNEDSFLDLFYSISTHSQFIYNYAVPHLKFVNFQYPIGWLSNANVNISNWFGVALSTKTLALYRCKQLFVYIGAMRECVFFRYYCYNKEFSFPTKYQVRERRAKCTNTLGWKRIPKNHWILSLLSNHIHLFLKYHIAPNERLEKKIEQKEWNKSEFVMLNISISVLFFALSALTHSLTVFQTFSPNAIVIKCSVCCACV